MKKKNNLFVGLTIFCSLLCACSTNEDLTTSVIDDIKDVEVNVGSKEVITKENVFDFFTFACNNPEDDAGVMSPKDNYVKFLSFNVGVNINVTYEFATTINYKEYTFNEATSTDEYIDKETELISTKKINFKSNKIDDTQFNSQSTFEYTSDVLENDYKLPDFLKSSNIYNISYRHSMRNVEYEAITVEGYAIYNEKCYGYKFKHLTLETYEDYFSITWRNTEHLLNIYVSTEYRNEKYSPLMLKDINIDIKVVEFNNDWTIKNESTIETSKQFLNTSGYNSFEYYSLQLESGTGLYGIKATNLSCMALVK